MNYRQKMKRLKNENSLMKAIIENTDEMKKLYDCYNQPMQGFHTEKQVKRFCHERYVDNAYLEMLKRVEKEPYKAIRRDEAKNYIDEIADNIGISITRFDWEKSTIRSELNLC